MHLKGKRGEPCFHTGGRVQYEQYTRGNTSSCHK
uniref:Uncharacterized protein n=1 Tax=Arundo donax TaxID=35708 RepID=A0A0A9EQ57_ARUDO